MPTAKVIQILAQLLVSLGGAEHYPLQVHIIRTHAVRGAFIWHGSGEAAYFKDGIEGKRFLFKYAGCQPLKAANEWNYPAALGPRNYLDIVSPNNNGHVCRLSTWDENN